MRLYAYTFVACTSLCRRIFSLANVNYIDPIMIVTATMKLIIYM